VRTAISASWRARLGLLQAGFAALLVTAASAAPASAQSAITLDRYSAAETTEDGFAISRPNDLGHLRFGAMLHVDYASDPLVVELASGSADSESAAAVSDELVGHLRLAFGIAERLVLFGGLDAVFLMNGDDFVDPETGGVVNLADGGGLGDARFGGRLRLVGDNDAVASLGLQLTATFPTADAADDAQRLRGEESVNFLPELLFELRLAKIFRVTANLGVRVRENVSLNSAEIADTFEWGMGLTLAPAESYAFLVEAYGATPFTEPGDRESSPIELIGGMKFFPGGGWALGAAGGPGLQRGFGSPDFRVVGMLGWTKPVEEEKAPGDRDGDGLLDADDKCPGAPEDHDDFKDADGCPDPDNDKDGIVDRHDECPLDPEDADEFQDADGCPDPDNDKDGVLDAVDQCALEPEDTDAFQDEDGCPDLDDDEDGLFDRVDDCPREPEDKDGFDDEDGCPDPDNDQDGILDDDDKCPLQKGVPEQQGCPNVIVEDDRIVILERVEFAVNKDVILKKSESILEALRETLDANSQIRRVRIEGHTDDKGKDKKNLELSRRRARSVVRWLVAHGLSASRFEAWGCGETRPLQSNDAELGRQANRRVEFHIVDPSPDVPRSTVGCQEAAK
jgi:outer membrane protein OmpA-like peptidoglycan-associated protein